jgi:hypothetical protein
MASSYCLIKTFTGNVHAKFAISISAYRPLIVTAGVICTLLCDKGMILMQSSTVKTSKIYSTNKSQLITGHYFKSILTEQS